MSSRLKRQTVRFRDEDFLIREWTPAERAAALKLRETEPHLFSSSVVYACTLKEDGSRFFPSEKAVQGEPAELVDDLAAAILKLSGVNLDGDDVPND